MTGLGWNDRRRDWIFWRRMRGDGITETGRHGQTSLLKKFSLFFLHNVFFLSMIHVFPLCLFFPLLLLCKIESGLRGGGEVCCECIEARYPQAILSTNAYIIHSFFGLSIVEVEIE